MDIKDQLNQIAQTLFHAAETMFEENSEDASRVMFASMLATGAAALLTNDGPFLKDILDDINQIIDKINVALISSDSTANLN